MIKVEVNAKINLSLYVGKAEGGYHALESVVASVGIAGVVSAWENGEFSVEFKSALEAEKTNAYKVALEMKERYDLPNFSLYIEDNIPSGAGLGSSSADCVGVIVALCELFSLPLSYEQKCDLALRFGSDTAYMLTGGYAVMRGRGEKITPFEASFYPEITVAYKGFVSTKECFDEFDKTALADCARDTDALVECLKNGSTDAFTYMNNDLFLPATTITPEIKSVVEASKPAFSVMTGSGSAVVIFDRSNELTERLKKIGATVIETKIVPFGVRVVKE